MKTLLCLAVMVAIFLTSGCATRPQERAEFKELPLLEKGMARVYVSAGKLNSVKLWSDAQVGPVYFNSQLVGSTASDEHFVVDVPQGSYEAYCTPKEPFKNYPQKLTLSFQAGQTRYLACDMETKGSGTAFGAIGITASDFITRSLLRDKPLDPSSKLVAYSKLK